MDISYDVLEQRNKGCSGFLTVFCSSKNNCRLASLFLLNNSSFWWAYLSERALCSLSHLKLISEGPRRCLMAVRRDARLLFLPPPFPFYFTPALLIQQATASNSQRHNYGCWWCCSRPLMGSWPRTRRETGFNPELFEKKLLQYGRRLANTPPQEAPLDSHWRHNVKCEVLNFKLAPRARIS